MSGKPWRNHLPKMVYIGGWGDGVFSGFCMCTVHSEGWETGTQDRAADRAQAWWRDVDRIKFALCSLLPGLYSNYMIWFDYDLGNAFSSLTLSLSLAPSTPLLFDLCLLFWSFDNAFKVSLCLVYYCPYILYARNTMRLPRHVIWSPAEGRVSN